MNNNVEDDDPRLRVTVSLDPESVKEIDEQVKKKIARNRSHAIDIAIKIAKREKWRL